MKLIFTLAFLVSSWCVFCQEEILSFQNLDFARSIRNVENYSLENTETKDLAIILAQKGIVQGYLYNSEFQKIGEGTAVHLKNKFSEVIGYIIKDSQYTLLFTTDARKKFGYISIDLENNKSQTEEIAFEFDKEKYVETISFNNRMIVLSATKENKLILREFTSAYEFKEIATFQFDSEDKQQRLLNRRSLFDFNFYDAFKRINGDIKKIDTRVPNRLDRTSTGNKLYHQDDKVYISFEDEDNNRTVVNILDLKNFTLDVRNFPYPMGKIGEYKSANSYIQDQKLFHIASSRDEMIFQIKNLDNEVLKEYYVDIFSHIDFKNSPIIQEGGNFRRKKRELDITKQYLRKITSGNIGLSIHKENNQYQITLGSYESLGGPGGGFSGGFAGGAPGVPIGALPVIYFPSYNSAFAAYDNYSISKSVFVNGLFDLEYNHIPGEEYVDNIFDRMQEFQENIKWETATDVFIYNNTTYFSYWSTKEQRYTLVKF